MPTKPRLYQPARLPTFKPRETRANSNQRGYTWRWGKARLAYLREHPLCVECEKEGRIVPATCVDHIVPHRGDEDRFWDQDNWQSLCVRHHGQKTARGE